MNKVATVRKYIKREEWKTLISECQASGMTIRDWCNLNGIKEQTYYRNLKKLREEMLASLPVPVQESEIPTVFQKLEVQAPLPSAQAAVIIHLPNATVEIADGTSQQTVQAVLLALQSVC